MFPSLMDIIDLKGTFFLFVFILIFTHLPLSLGSSSAFIWQLNINICLPVPGILSTWNANSGAIISIRNMFKMVPDTSPITYFEVVVITSICSFSTADEHMIFWKHDVWTGCNVHGFMITTIFLCCQSGYYYYYTGYYILLDLCW